MAMNVSVAKANALYRSGAYREALVLYEDIANRPGWRSRVRANIALCRRRLGFVSHDGMGASATERPEIIITLTTIRSRLPYVPKVIESLLNQTLMPERIDLNISDGPYLMDEGIAQDDPILIELMKQPLLRVNWVPNTGSYRKIWSMLVEHFSKTVAQDRLFVTVDDDTLYPDYFLARLHENYLKHDCVIAFRGRHIEMGQQGIAPYDQWTRGQVRPSLNNLPTGKDGILYSTKFFTRDFLNLAEARRVAPTADDLWIKWHCALNGVPSVILNPEACTSDYKSFPVVNYDQSYRSVSLYAMHNATEAQNKNDIAVEKLETHFQQVYGYNLAWMNQVEPRAST